LTTLERATIARVIEEPEQEQVLSRREVLKRGALLGIVVGLPAGTAFVGDALATSDAAGSAVLTPGQSTVLEAVVDRLIPADANGPGGVESGVAQFIERSLGGGLAGGLAKLTPMYASGLDALDAYAKSAYGAPFASLPPQGQDAILGDLETGRASGFTPDSATFFAFVREHALEGMFSDPIYGGNKNFAGWDLVGYPGVKMPVPAADQRVGVVVKRAHRSTYSGGSLGSYPKAKKQAIP
jgi:gluconate 2-dehydrogenase gamma chain